MSELVERVVVSLPFISLPRLETFSHPAETLVVYVVTQTPVPQTNKQ